jgi:hypothetical protein
VADIKWVRPERMQRSAMTWIGQGQRNAIKYHLAMEAEVWAAGKLGAERIESARPIDYDLVMPDGQRIDVKHVESWHKFASLTTKAGPERLTDEVFIYVVQGDSPDQFHWAGKCRRSDLRPGSEFGLRRPGYAIWLRELQPVEEEVA